MQRSRQPHEDYCEEKMSDEECKAFTRASEFVVSNGILPREMRTLGSL